MSRYQRTITLTRFGAACFLPISFLIFTGCSGPATKVVGPTVTDRSLAQDTSAPQTSASETSSGAKEYLTGSREFKGLTKLLKKAFGKIESYDKVLLHCTRTMVRLGIHSAARPLGHDLTVY